MANITWNGLSIDGDITRDRGTYMDPPWTEVEIGEISVEDEEEFSMFLEEKGQPADWKNLPKEAINWIVGKYEEEISESLDLSEN